MTGSGGAAPPERPGGFFPAVYREWADARSWYTTATPAFGAADPTPTVFSGYTGSQAFGNILEFSTAAGPITLVFDLEVGVNASIHSVPEPSSPALCGIGGSIGLVVARRHRKRAG